MINSNNIGYDAKIYNYKFLNKFSNGIPEQSDSTPNDKIKGQYGFFKEKFGENAWENVTYKIVKANCPSKKEEYINTETNQILSEKEANTVIDKFWRNFAEEKGVDYKEFLSPKDYCGELDKEENMNILTAMELGYKPPVSVNRIEKTIYSVCLFIYYRNIILM